MEDKTKICKLCWSKKLGPDSHLFPKFSYKLIRDPLSPNPDPVTVRTARKRYQSSLQIKEKMLCDGCEDLVNKNGERYFSSLFDYEKRQHKIDQILTQDRFKEEGLISTQGYLDGEKIAYFATSIFWRFDNASKVLEFAKALGPYRDDFQRFLLGQSEFPDNTALLFSVLQEPDNDSEFGPLYFNGMAVPHTARHKLFRLHRFWITGLMFDLYIGKQIPGVIRDLCYATSTNRRAIIANPDVAVQRSYSERWLNKIVSSPRSI